MNLVGKIFTVLILVMSLVFMSLAVAVYATHKNWKDVVDNPEATQEKPLGLEQQLQNLRSQNEDLEAKLTKLERDKPSEIAAKTQALGKLETENEELKRARTEHEQQYARLVESEGVAAAAAKAAHDTLAALRKENEGLRGDIVTAQKDRDTQFKDVVRLTDELHQAVFELQQLKKRNLTLADDHAKALEVLQLFNLKPDAALYSGKTPDVEGLVLAVQGGGLVEISIGSDDGLLQGHKLEVFRVAGGTSTYVGRIEVVKTAPDKSVCKILPEFQKSATIRGDRVAAKLR